MEYSEFYQQMEDAKGNTYTNQKQRPTECADLYGIDSWSLETSDQLVLLVLEWKILNMIYSPLKELGR